MLTLINNKYKIITKKYTIDFFIFKNKYLNIKNTVLKILNNFLITVIK